MQIRDYQKDIINLTLGTTESTLIQLPTGAGKTIIAKEIIKELITTRKKNVLFITPKIILMKQTMDVFYELNPLKVHGNELYDKEHHLLVSTIQTAHRRDLMPDVIFIDEIHYGFNGKMIAHLIKDKPNARIIGLSATPYDKNGAQLEGFNFVINKYDVNYMIKNKYLVPITSYELVRIYNLDKVSITGGDYNQKELSKIVSNNKTILEIINTTIEYIHERKKTIVFAVDINHAELLSKAYTNEGFVSRVIHSKISKDQQALEIDNFKNGKTKILVSVLMLTTGFDVPDTDCVIIARPTKSQNLYKQMVGRVLRTVEDGSKKDAILLDCGNVIENLGQPLEPIKENKQQKESIQANTCEKCKSDKLKLVKHQEFLYWECQKCGFKKDIEQGVYECKICKKKYTHNAKFEIKDNKLYLVCGKCPYPTLISQFTGNEKLVEVIDKKYSFNHRNEISLEEKLRLKKNKQKENEHNNKLSKEFINKIRKRFRNQYLSFNQNDRDNMSILRDYLSIVTVKEKYDAMVLRLLKLDNGYFNIDYINNKENLDEFFIESRIKFYKSYIQEIYQKKLTSYAYHFMFNTLNTCSKEEVLEYRLPSKIKDKIYKIENEFINMLNNEEKTLIEKISTISFNLYLNSGSYSSAIELDPNRSIMKIDKK